MKMKCKIHGVQDITFYALNGKIRRECSICHIEKRLKNYTDFLKRKKEYKLPNLQTFKKNN